jgi:2-desacetyl-2-hydroxyethyl bacteriochlorophyllide A dehydrogenase
MRAVRFLGERRAVVIDQDEPRPGPGQVLVAIRAAGICGTDLHSYRARLEDYPKLAEFVPGHEPCGDIAELGPDVTGWSVHDRVVVYHRITCMTCRYCATGMRNLCVDNKGVYGFGPDGANAEFMVANADELLPLPADFDYLDGVLFACQVGTAYNALKMMAVDEGETLVVLGLGPVGLFGVLLGAAYGARVAAVDPSPERRKLAERIGASVVIDPEDQTLPRAIARLSGGGADHLLETSGAPSAHKQIVKVLRPNGQAALVGMGAREVSLKLAPVITRQLRIVGSSAFSFDDFDEIVAFVRERRVRIRDIVTHELSLEQAPRGFEIADAAKSGKVVFRVA